MKLQVYQADTPVRGAYGSFISLGNTHNYGCCFELVCWVNNQQSNADTCEEPRLGLLYAFEVKRCKPAWNIKCKDAIIQLRSAIKSLKSSPTMYPTHNSYMVLSASYCLEQLLLQYSNHLYQVHMAERIQKVWLWHYWTPDSPICQRIRKRQFEELNKELYEHLARPY